MDRFFCPDCAAKRGQVTGVGPSNLTGSTYQMGKINKHTHQLTASANPISVFDDPSIPNYVGLTTSAYSTGWYAVNGQGQWSIVWNANKQVGHTYSPSGQRIDSGLRVVCLDNHQKTHSYTTANSEIRGAACAGCGKPYTS